MGKQEHAHIVPCEKCVYQDKGYCYKHPPTVIQGDNKQPLSAVPVADKFCGDGVIVKPEMRGTLNDITEHLSPENKRISADDFFTGLFAALAAKGFTSMTNDRFELAVSKVFKRLLQEETHEFDFRFRIRPEPSRGGSATVRESLSNAVLSDLIRLEYRNIFVKLSKYDANSYLEKMPVERRCFFNSLVDNFINEYEQVGF
jgi:hypothetical protein